MPSDDDEIGVEFGSRVRERREALGLNQTDLGALAGVHRATIRAIELGRRVESRSSAVVNGALGCTNGAEPVLSARLARLIAEALLFMRSENTENQSVFVRFSRSDVTEPIDPDSVGVVSDYIDLVEAAADARSTAKRRLPENFDRFRDSLPLSGPQRRLLDDELAGIFGDVYPYAQRTTDSGHAHFTLPPPDKIGTYNTAPELADAIERWRASLDNVAETASHMRPAILAIMQASLPEAAKVDIIDYVSMRERQFEAQLYNEVSRLLAAIQAGIASGQDEGYGDGKEDQ